jgi:hypothetical protein
LTNVPGRHEIDDTQELNYRSVAKTIADLGYSGDVAHEYRPAPGRDAQVSLKQAIEIVTVWLPEFAGQVHDERPYPNDLTPGASTDDCHRTLVYAFA